MGRNKLKHIDNYLPLDFFHFSEEEIYIMKDIAEQSPCSDKKKILFMDDQSYIQNVARRMLMYLGYEVKFASDGAETIELYKKAKELGRPFDAVILDLTIPGGMGGKCAIQKLVEVDPDVKAIISSGYSNDPIISEYKQYGFSGVVTKPYTINELSDTLNQSIVRVIEPSYI